MATPDYKSVKSSSLAPHQKSTQQGPYLPSTPTPRVSRILLIDHSHTPDINQPETPSGGDTTQNHRRRAQPLWASSCSVTEPLLNTSSSIGGYVTYKCKITATATHSDQMLLASPQPHAIRKRYSEFAILRSKLHREFPDVYTPHLPVKSYSLSQTTNLKFLEQRRGGLELFLRSVVLNPDIGGSAAVLDWLKISPATQEG